MCEGPPRQWDQYHNRPQPAIATDRPLLLKPRARHGPQLDRLRESLQGKYAGFASRFAAFAADVGQCRRVHAHPGRHLVRGQGADRQGHLLEQERHLGGHRVRGLAVRPLRLLLGRERQDRRHGAVELPVPILHPAWSGGWSGIASAFSMGIWVPSGMTTRTGTLTSRTPFSYRAVTSAASTLAGSLTVRASDP